MKFGLTSFCIICTLLYGEVFAVYHSNNEQSNLSRSSSNSSLSSSDSDDNINSSDDFDSDAEITYSTDTSKEPQWISVPPKPLWVDEDGGEYRFDVLILVLCVYSKDLNTENPQFREWLKEGRVFPNLEQLKITDDDLKIVTKKKNFKKLKMLKVTNSVKNLDELIKALSKTPNLEELILINTGIIQKLVRIADKLIDLPLIKKVTLQEKELTEIPDTLLILPNIEQITIGEKTYFKTDLEKERSSRHISIISYDDKKNLIQDVKEGRLDAVKQKIKEIDFLDIREDLSKIAVSGGHTEVLKLLLNNRVDINARYEDGNTFLMEASKKGYFDIVKLLIDRGANVKEKNKEGKTAFSLAFDLAKSESHRHKKDKK